MSDNNTIDLSDITLGDLIDTAILSHGFTIYKRDYYFHIETLWKEPYAGQYIVLFRHCYDFAYRTLTGAETLIQSWDDIFIDIDTYEKAGAPEGYVWGSNHIGAYPGFTKFDNSPKAIEWTKKLGRQMNEVEVEGEIFRMNLIYHDWTIKKLNDNTSLISQLIFPLKE
jgi:hypothetical protein